MLTHQKTLADTIIIIGKGLHTGRIVRVEILPAKVNTGIVFQRTDNDQAEPVLAHAGNISATELCTTLSSGASSVSTIEHLMAAFSGLGVDNALVRLNGPEVPILDGSAKPFVDRFIETGLVELNAPRSFFIVKKRFRYEEADRFVEIEPSRDLLYECSVDYGKSFIGCQSLQVKMNSKEFLKLCYARTFCHVNEVKALQNAGLAQGGSLENAIVVTETGVLNEEGLRSDDEFVRHKLLDCIGDLALLNATLIGKVTVHKPGHGLHAGFMNELWKKRATYLELVNANLELEKDFRANLALVGGVAFG